MVINADFTSDIIILVDIQCFPVLYVNQYGSQCQGHGFNMYELYTKTLCVS